MVNLSIRTWRGQLCISRSLGSLGSLEQCESGCQQTTETLTEAPCSAGPRASCRAYRLILPPSPPQRRCLTSPANPWHVAWVRNGGIGGYYGILQVPRFTKIHQVKYSAPNPSKSHPFQTCSNHPSFGVAECCHSSPECGGRGGVDCCMKTVPKRTRETSQRRSGDNTCRDIDVEVLCGPAGFHMISHVQLFESSFQQGCSKTLQFQGLMTHFPPLWISFPYRLESPVGQEILALTSSTPCPTCPHQCQRDSRRLNAQGRGKSPQSSRWPCQRGYPSMEPQELSLRIASASPNHEAHQAVLNSKLGKSS